MIVIKKEYKTDSLKVVKNAVSLLCQKCNQLAVVCVEIVLRMINNT